MPTRQTSSSGRPKSPRIQVVLPEDLCQRLAVLADDESRTVSNMAKVLIQQGVERLEHQRQHDGQAAAAPVAATPASAAPPAATPAPPAPQPPASSAPPAATEATGSAPGPGAEAAADRFRAELERSEAQGPRRLRGVPRRLRLRPPGG